MNDETPTAPEPIVARKSTAPGGFRHTLTAALVGGLCGALAAGGVFLATDDDTTPAQSSASQAVISRPSSTLDGGSDIASLLATAEPAVVAITVGQGPGTGAGGAGTGFVITADGFIVTNNHVVEGQTRIEVAFTDGETMSARTVGRDPSVDLAVLKVDGTNLAFIELGDSDAVQVGDEVVAIGNALALEGGLSVTRGIISGTNRTVRTNEGSTLVGMLQTDAAINFGNSGGPLIDAEGRVIGVNTAIDADAQNVGFAIPISRAKPVIDDLRAGRKPAFLGVSTQNVTPALSRELGLDVDSGAYVTQVTQGTPADRIGIQEGDVIVQIGDDAIETSADVLTAVRSHRPGDDVEVIVDRNGERITLTATLRERPDVE
ncbi:MAG: PDZ domain-containing protein [Acidimicrobiia bacterium]|nr:PDZ domain-containing protein [Acidimicrobiia bacterium]